MSVVWKRLSDIFFLVRYIQILQQHFTLQGLAFRIGMQGMKRGQQMPKFHLLSSKNDITVYSFHPYMPSQKNLLITKSRFLFFIFMIWSFKKWEFKLKNQDTFFKMRKKISKLKTVGIVILVRVFYIDRFRLSAVFFVLHEWNCERRVLQ